MKKVALVLVVLLLLPLFHTAAADTTILYLVTFNESPSTDYSWYYVVSDDTVITVVDHGFTPSDNAQDAAAGEGGKHTWTVGGLKEGEATATFTYMRLWNPEPTDFVFTFTFVVDSQNNLSIKSTERLPEDFAPGKIAVRLIENPTTGYHWTMEMEPEGIIKLIVDSYVQDDAPDTMVGVGGVHYWIFRGAQKGEVRLVFRYMGPGDDDQEPLATVIYTYAVDGKLAVTRQSVGGDYDQYTPYGR